MAAKSRSSSERDVQVRTLLETASNAVKIEMLTELVAKMLAERDGEPSESQILASLSEQVNERVGRRVQSIKDDLRRAREIQRYPDGVEDAADDE